MVSHHIHSLIISVPINKLPFGGIISHHFQTPKCETDFSSNAVFVATGKMPDEHREGGH